jgi:uncharacterized protein (TIGR03435 family)
MRIANELLPELVLAVLNSLWQAVVVAAVAWATLRLTRKINAATRYAIWWAVLAVVLALPFAPGAARWWQARGRAAEPAAVNRPAPARAAIPSNEDRPAIVTLTEQRSARWPLWIAGLWAGLCAYRLWQVGRSYFYLRGVKGRSRVAPGTVAGGALEAAFRRPRLLLSKDVASPMAVGFLHPAVILPEDLPGELGQVEMEHVLLHEAAHIARRDDWANLLAKLLRGALALHPVAWWVLREIEREREIACDDWVVARVGSARPYAESLARMSELRWARRSRLSPKQGEALASGIFGGGSRLGRRIERLLEREREFSAEASAVRVAIGGAMLLGCAIAGAIAPNVVALAQERPRFEAATVKPGNPDIHGTRTSTPPGRVVLESITLREAVRMAYQLNEPELFGGPKWVDSEHYDIEGKAEGVVSREQRMLMLQSLLVDRFKLKLHRETREIPLYALTVAKGGPKLTPSTPNGGSSSGPRNVTAKGATIEVFARMLSDVLMQPVVDRTGLTGNYDVRVDFAPMQGPADDTAPSLFTAIQEQLGLKLESTKGPVEVVVIDSAEKPDAN